MKTLTKIIVVASLALPQATVYACEFHDTPMFGAFGQNHPMMNRAISAQTDRLVVDHAKALVARVNEPVVVNIKYHLPLDYRDVTLDFESEEGVELQPQEPVAIGQKNGEYALNMSAVSEGSHIVTIRVAAYRNGSPYSHVQQVKLVAF